MSKKKKYNITLPNFLKISLFKGLSFIQKLGLGSKTHSIFLRLPKGNDYTRKGHLLKNPTQDQIDGILTSVLKNIKVENWEIIDNTVLYTMEPGWKKRPEAIIDKIIINSTDSARWNAEDLFDNDISENNLVTEGTPLPGISTHLFINASGVIEKVADFNNLIWHTPSVNARSVNIVLQYLIKNNNSAPQQKILTSLERLLTLLCLQFKLNPYKAIRGQREVKFKWLPFIKGNRNNLDVSPGLIVPLNAIREKVAFNIQKKLKYAKLYDGEINGKINRATKKAINKFHSKAIEYSYHKIKLVSRNIRHE